MKKLTTAQLDKQILDHADEIIRLMKLKGMKDDDKLITIWLGEGKVEVEHILQSICTKSRKKK